LAVGKSIALTRCSRLRLLAGCDSVKRLAFDGMTSILKVGKFVSVNSCPRKRPGAPLHPRNVLRMLHMLLTRADLPVRRFHDLRHSAASLLIAAGVQLAESRCSSGTRSCA